LEALAGTNVKEATRYIEMMESASQQVMELLDQLAYAGQ
jgi:hypothetical protein